MAKKYSPVDWPGFYANKMMIGQLLFNTVHAAPEADTFFLKKLELWTITDIYVHSILLKYINHNNVTLSSQTGKLSRKHI